MESLMNFIHAWRYMCCSTCCNISLDAQPNTLRSRSMSSTLHLYSSPPLLSFVPFCFLAGIAIGHVGFPHILLCSLEQSLHVGFDALKLIIWIFPPSAVLSSSSVVFQRLQTVADASPDTRRGFLSSWSRILGVADRLGLGGSTG